MDFAEKKLEEWGLTALKETFADNCIDDQTAFELLTDEAIREMVPKVGLRLKFLAKFKQYMSKNQTLSQDKDETDDRGSPILDTSLASDDASSISDSTCIDEEPTPKNRPSERYEIREVILKTPNGEQIVTALDAGLLEIKQRQELTRILVSHLMTMHGDRPTTNEKIALAKRLIEEFPSQKDSEGEGYEAWFSRGRGSHSSSGYLEQRLRNVRKRTGKTVSRVAKVQKLPLTKTTVGATEISAERAKEMKNWLRHNTMPKEQVQQFMRDTVSFRVNWIKSNPTLSVMQIKEEFPRLLDTPGMIEQDFSAIYTGEVGDRFLSKWELYCDAILTYADSQTKSWKKYLGIQSSDDIPDKSIVAAQMLPCILPTGLVKNTHGKAVRATTTEAVAAFIDAQPIGTNIPHYLQQIQADGKKRQPFLLLLGLRLSPSQVFLIIDGLAIEQPTLFKAIDACFKAFYVFDLRYPKQCHTTWEFLQKFFFQLADGKGKEVTSAAVRSLRTYLEQV